MNAVKQAARRHEEEINLGHPVRSFVFVMVGVALLLVVLQWSGAVMPLVSEPGGGHSESDELQVFWVQIRNDGGAPFRVTAVDWPTTNTEGSLMRVTESLDEPSLPTKGPLEPFDVEAGGERWLSLYVVPACDSRIADPVLKVHTYLGITRTVDLGDGQEPELVEAC